MERVTLPPLAPAFAEPSMSPCSSSRGLHAFACVFASALALAGLAVAQSTPGELVYGGTPFVGSTGGIVVAAPSNGTFAELAGLPPEIRRPAAVVSDPFDRSRLFAASNDVLGNVQVFRVDVAAGAVVGFAPLLAQPLPELEAMGMAAVGEDILLLTRFGLHRIAKAGGAPLLVMTLPPQTWGRALATDGRRIFASITNREIYRMDVLDPGNAGLFATLPGSLGAIQDLALDENGDLLVADSDPWNGSFLRLLDASTGLERQSTALRLSPPLALAHDPLLLDDYVAGIAAGQSWISVMRSGQEVGRLGPLPYLPGSLDLIRTAPLYLSGSGCASSTGTVARYDSSHLPVLGTANYDLHLFGAPSGPAALLLGARASGRPPFELPLGPAAPNCSLEVLPDLALPIYVTASGEARIYFDIPLDASLAGAIIDSQWWILDPAANALGIAASQRGTAIVE